MVYNKLLRELEGVHDCFTKHKRKKKNCHKSIHWLIHVFTHSCIYSNIPSFNKCRLMKTSTNADSCLSQLKVVTWIHSWLFLTVVSLWGSEVMRELLPWMEFCQAGRVFVFDEVEVVGILWKREAGSTRI